MNKYIVLFSLVVLMTACAQIEPEPFEVSDGHISPSETPDTKAEIPQLVENAPVLPEPTESKPQEKYTVVVNEVPVKELLFALARDAKINVDIHPEIDGVVTINAVDQTLPQILKRISKQVDMRYEYDGENLLISRDTPFLRTYSIDYVNMSREMTGTNTVATQISSTSSGDTSGSGGGGGGSGNNSTTGVTSESVNSYWETLTANIIAILDEESGQSGGSAESNSVIANPESGLLTVRATAQQHEEIQKFIDLSLVNIKRQVLIRATIAEVQLSEDYQAGIDWSVIQEATKAGFEITSSTINPVSGALSSFIIDYVDPNTSRDQRFQATISLLDDFGDTRILSSPQLMVLNNQTALLKVVENIVYFEIETDTTATQGVSTTTFDTTAQTVPVGIVMAVTPQISKSGEISLNVRPTISRVTEFVNDPNPSLVVGGTTLSNPVPQIQVREMESMLRLTDGQIGVLGGLMQDQSSDVDDGLPWVKDLPGIGAAFKTKTYQQQKTELIIFLQPFIINNPGLDTDLEQYRQYLDDLSVSGNI